MVAGDVLLYALAASAPVVAEFHGESDANKAVIFYREDDFVGRMLWALSDSSALPAKRFAEFNPAPALDWLQAFDEQRYRHCDLERFGIPPIAKVDDKLSFSLIHRPRV